MSIPKVEVINHQSAVKLRRGFLRRLWMTANRLVRREGVKVPVRVIIVDDQYLKRLKSQFLEKEGPPDVLAFPLGSEAEVYVSAQEAARRGEVHAQIARLVVHGLLHLAGYSHGEEMERKTQEHLSVWK